MRNLPRTISSLPTKPFLPPTLSIGTDICHIPRILRLLTRSPRPGVGWQFARKIMGEEELGNCRHVFERSFERVDALKRSWWLANGFRRKVGVGRVKGFEEMGSEGGKERGIAGQEVKMEVELLQEVLGKGYWELGQSRAKTKAKSNTMSKGDEGEVSKEGLLIDVLRSVVNWKKYNGLEGLRTPWSVVIDGVKGGGMVEDVTSGVIDALRALSGKEELVKDVREEEIDDQIQILDTTSTTPEIDTAGEQIEQMQPRAESTIDSSGTPDARIEIIADNAHSGQIQSVEASSTVGAHLEQTELPEGLRDDLSIFLEIETQLLKHLSQAEALLQKPAIFLAGRFAAKEAIMKAHHSRRLTYHDIVILKQPPNEHGSQAPLAFVLGEGEAREVRFSISHDGDYATATALVHEDDGHYRAPARADAGEEPMVVRRVQTRSLSPKPEDTSRATVEEEELLKVRKVSTGEGAPPIFLW